jgi:hypothetical protein
MKWPELGENVMTAIIVLMAMGGIVALWFYI